MERSERNPRRVQQEDPIAAAATGNLDDELLTNLAQASGTDALPAAWLAVQCRLLRGGRRGVLLLGPANRGPFSIAATWPEGDGSGHSALLDAAQRALGERRGFALPPPDRAREGQLAALEGALLVEPVLVAESLHGVAVVEVLPRPLPELEGMRREFRFGFGWLHSFVQQRRAVGESIGKTQLEMALALLAAALEQERFQGAATAFATELASELGCDRVSVGFPQRGRMRVRALSHSAQFGERASLIRAIEASMDEAVDQRATVVFPTHESGIPRAAHAHAELARQFGSTAICTVPLVRDGKPCGAVTLERAEPLEPRALVLLDVVAALVGPALDSLRREDRLVIAKVGESLHDLFASLVGPRHVALKLTVIGLTAVTLFLALADGDYRVAADATLEPAVKRAAVAPFEGFIATAPVRPGDVVKEGTLLGSLDDRELMLDRIRWESKVAQSSTEYRQALAERDAAKVEILAASMQEARTELALNEDRLARVALRAPFDGIVVSGDLTQRLGAPVKRGEVLFEVAPFDRYRVHLQVKEREIAEVTVGDSGKLLLSSAPGEPLAITVDKITPVAEAEEGKNTFLVEAHLDEESARLRPGLEGVAKIDVGERRLLWIWIHDGIDWVRLKLWNWTP